MVGLVHCCGSATICAFTHPVCAAVNALIVSGLLCFFIALGLGVFIPLHGGCLSRQQVFFIAAALRSSGPETGGT